MLAGSGMYPGHLGIFCDASCSRGLTVRGVSPSQDSAATFEDESPSKGSRPDPVACSCLSRPLVVGCLSSSPPFSSPVPFAVQFLSAQNLPQIQRAGESSLCSACGWPQREADFTGPLSGRISQSFSFLSYPLPPPPSFSGN